ncbi:MAG: sigma-54 dependent transcriptional regulator [Muribaculaceae bacterium]|nr:sigma-54 dependent transcriptional regulator [Muribaculaceae bacterium]
MILIVDDDSSILLSLRTLLRREGYEAATASSPAEAIDFVRVTKPELVLMDMNYSRATDGAEGLELLRALKIFCPHTPIILMTAWGSIDLAVGGMRAGAFDFLTKPWDRRILLERVATALKLADNTESTKAASFNRSAIIGSDPALLRALELAERVAPTDASVLITGESGTGKELIAEAVHRNSRRADKAFVKVNLGGVPQTLFESEMFGYRKGAFTGAVADRTGRFEAADGGTIFLDEIGELDAPSQVKMLRVLQEQSFEPLGSSVTRHVDVRVVCATNANLPKMVAEHSFREDLYYRINLVEIKIPPLRERASDIGVLARHFASAPQFGNVEIDDDAVAFLRALPFPGNIRELKNLVERAILVSGKNLLSAADFKPLANTTPIVDGNTLEQMERRRIEQALADADGNISRAAAALGLSRPALYRRLEKYGLQ